MVEILNTFKLSKEVNQRGERTFKSQERQLNNHVLYILKFHETLVLIFMIMINVSIKKRRKIQRWVSYRVGGR